MKIILNAFLLTTKCKTITLIYVYLIKNYIRMDDTYDRTR